MVRALEDGRTGWLVLAGSLVGFGFLDQDAAGVPRRARASRLVYLLAGADAAAAPDAAAARGPAVALARRRRAGGSPSSSSRPRLDRPYIGGSQDNSILNLIFGYNGFGRLTGNESGSVGGGAQRRPGGGAPTGWARLFGNEHAAARSRGCIPAALIVLVAGLVAHAGGAPRTDRTRAALLLWGGWLVVTGAVFSFAQGIIHPYYTVALAPAIGALVGIGATMLWQRRRHARSRG